MNDLHVSGSWTGVYTYSNEYDTPVKGRTVTFEMTISVENGQIRGECTDAEAKTHFHQPATIIGSVTGDTIQFIKRYPYYWQHEKNGPRFLPKLPSQEVWYAGRFVQEHFEGEWEIVTFLTDAQGDTVRYRGVGSWYMRRA